MRYFGDDDYADHWEEVERLRALNAELVRAAKDLIGMASAIENAVNGTPHTAQSVAYVLEQFRAVIAKTKGEV